MRYLFWCLLFLAQSCEIQSYVELSIDQNFKEKILQFYTWNSTLLLLLDESEDPLDYKPRIIEFDSKGTIKNQYSFDVKRIMSCHDSCIVLRSTHSRTINPTGHFCFQPKPKSTVVTCNKIINQYQFYKRDSVILSCRESVNPFEGYSVNKDSRQSENANFSKKSKLAISINDIVFDQKDISIVLLDSSFQNTEYQSRLLFERKSDLFIDEIINKFLHNQ